VSGGARAETGGENGVHNKKGRYEKKGKYITSVKKNRSEEPKGTTLSATATKDVGSSSHNKTLEEVGGGGSGGGTLPCPSGLPSDTMRCARGSTRKSIQA
jgi:hypothetical protein